MKSFCQFCQIFLSLACFICFLMIMFSHLQLITIVSSIIMLMLFFWNISIFSELKNMFVKVIILIAIVILAWVTLNYVITPEKMLINDVQYYYYFLSLAIILFVVELITMIIFRDKTHKVKKQKNQQQIRERFSQQTQPNAKQLKKQQKQQNKIANQLNEQNKQQNKIKQQSHNDLDTEML